MIPTQNRTIEAPAKLNLGLAVTGRRPDGYHELRSVFVRIGLVDRLSGIVGDGLPADRLRIEGADELEPAEDICLRAIQRLRRGAGGGGGLSPLDMVLDKRIPVGAGLGGGSSDAAAALALASRLWSLGSHPDRMAELSAELGADVPFFARGLAAASVSGIGDSIEALPPVNGGAALLVTPGSRLSTKAVFDAFDRSARRGSRVVTVIDDLVAAFRAGLDGPALAGLAPTLRDANDLWAAALELEPPLGALRDHLEETLERPVLLTGSGSTLFALYPSFGEADLARGRVRMDADRSPVAGARLIAAVPFTTDVPLDQQRPEDRDR